MHHDADHGLEHDLKNFTLRKAGRREVLRWMFGASITTWIGCSGQSNSSAPSNAAGTCATIPDETEGPYPGDGTNGPNALSLSGIVRSDIRSSVGAATGVADGIPLTVVLTVVDGAAGCSPVAGHAVYLWHCDRAGNYSMYSAAAANENYLRGVQETDADGSVTFTTIFPACYMGRWPHIHFEIYPSLAMASSGTNKVATSQLALPKETCDAVYATAGYESSITTLAGVSLESDMVFRDGVSLELATITGSVAEGFTARLTVTL